MPYSDRQQSYLTQAEERVCALFAIHPDDVHGVVHARIVAEHAERIAVAEGVDPFLSVLAGWLHDIGRAIEGEEHKQFSASQEKKTHHELSYDMLREWLQEDSVLSTLSDDEKREVLYSVRYHWNDYADEYISAIILRDADKLDSFGKRGIQRTMDFWKEVSPRITDIRLRYHMYYNLRTDAAKRYAREHDVLAPIDAYLRDHATKAISAIEL